MKIYLQAEASECGLACLAMISSHFRGSADLVGLRQKFTAGLRGVDLDRLSEFATELGFLTRSLRLDLDELSQLSLPCILHWNMDHFVVLTKVRNGSIIIIDPARGERRLSMVDASRHFTGIAMELAPRADYRDKTKPSPAVSLQGLTGKTRGLRRSLAQIFAVAVVLQAFALLAPLLNQLVVDEIIATGDLQKLVVVGIGFLLLSIIQTAIAACRTWMITVLSQTLALQWAGNVFAHLLKLPLSYFERRHLGDITSRFSSIHSIQNTLTTAAIEALLDGVMASLALVMMFLYSKTLGLIVLGAVLAYLALRIASYRAGKDIASDQIVLAAREQTYFLETLRAIQPLKLFNRHEQRRQRWQNIVVDLQNIDMSMAKLGILTTSARSIIFSFENIAVLYFGSRIIIDASSHQQGASYLTIGMLMAFMSYKSQFSNRAVALIDFAISFRLLSVHRERLADIVLTKPEPSFASTGEVRTLLPKIEFINVGFRHSPHEPWILRGLNFKINVGECVCLTGISGSGKTTLAKLILRIHEPSEGEILYGGVPLKRLRLSDFRDCVGSVMQDDSLLAGTISENISFFSQKHEPQRIEAAAKLANIHAEIQQLPMAYRTLIGDLGTGLSGGQQQRLLLARALYGDPQLLVLDEATSHLDAGNELDIVSKLRRLNCTRVVIAHRAETIANCDREFRVSAGGLYEVIKEGPD